MLPHLEVYVYDSVKRPAEEASCTCSAVPGFLDRKSSQENFLFVGEDFVIFFLMHGELSWGSSSNLVIIIDLPPLKKFFNLKASNISVTIN